MHLSAPSYLYEKMKYLFYRIYNVIVHLKYFKCCARYIIEIFVFRAFINILRSCKIQVSHFNYQTTINYIPEPGEGIKIPKKLAMPFIAFNIDAQYTYNEKRTMRSIVIIRDEKSIDAPV